MREQMPVPAESSPLELVASPRPQEVIDARLIEQDGPELREYGKVLKKRGWIVVLCTLLAVSAVLVANLFATPLYTAENVVLIEPLDPEVIEIKQVMGSSRAWEDSYYGTQYELLWSRSLAVEVIRNLRLDQEAAFFAGGHGPLSLAFELAEKPVDWIASWFPSASVELTEEEVVPALVNWYLSRLVVEPVHSSRLVRLHYTSADPQLSARIVNAHAAAYIERGLEMRNRASEEARAFLEEKLVDLRARVVDAETELNRYRRTHGILSLDEGENIVVDRLADLNARLTAAEARRIGLEADAYLVERRNWESLPAVIESSLVRTLKQQLAHLEGELASVARKFKPGYPRRAQLEAQVQETRTRLHREIGSIVAGIESAYLAARKNEAELRQTVEVQKSDALRLKDTSVEYAILAHDVETSRGLYDSVRQRVKETGMAADLRASNVFVIDRAHPPLFPSYPQTGRNVGFGLLLGLMAGVGLALLAEYLDTRLRDAKEVERLLQLPSLGVVPRALHLDAASVPQVSAARRRAGRPAHLPALRGAGAAALPDGLTEAYRSIRTSILLSQAGEPPKTILFSSSAECEGKTTTLLHTAAMFARMGAPVLVIDADLRRPSCHRALGLDNHAGLTEVLTGQQARMQRVQVGDSQLFFLGSGSMPPNPTELLGSPRMKEVLARLGQRFEYILIDSPPLIPVSDAVVLSTLVDGVVLVIDQQKVPRQMVQQARMRLAYARAKVLGFVLNRADPSAAEYAEFRREAA